MVKKCCCCIPVKTGAYIIGCFHVFGLLMGIYMFNPLQMSIDIFCGVTFLLMVYKDSEQKRMFYFAAYVVYSVIVGIIRIVFVLWSRDEDNIVREFCNNLFSALKNG